MRSAAWFGAVFGLCLAAVGAALVSQHHFDMQPCPWCVLQRVIYLAVALCALLGLVWRSAGGRAVSVSLGLLLTACGVLAALWQHFKAAASASCNLTLADKIISGLHLDQAVPDVFEPRASCAEAAVSVLGVPYDIWSLALYLVVGLMLRQALLARR